MMGGDDDDGDTIVETQEISSENLFQAADLCKCRICLRSTCLFDLKWHLSLCDTLVLMCHRALKGRV